VQWGGSSGFLHNALKSEPIYLATKLSGRGFIMIATWRDSSAYCSGEVLPACSIMPQQTALINLETKVS
jgi:hypothetical protein